MCSELHERSALLGVAIDVEPSRLEPWCDEVVAAHDMSRVDERAADALFQPVAATNRRSSCGSTS
jgi:hypothetical protein